jgi:hypothetical protein
VPPGPYAHILVTPSPPNLSFEYAAVLPIINRNMPHLFGLIIGTALVIGRVAACGQLWLRVAALCELVPIIKQNRAHLFGLIIGTPVPAVCRN